METLDDQYVSMWLTPVDFHNERQKTQFKHDDSRWIVIDVVNRLDNSTFKIHNGILEAIQTSKINDSLIYYCRTGFAEFEYKNKCCKVDIEKGVLYFIDTESVENFIKV